MIRVVSRQAFDPDQPGRSFAARAASAISASHQCRLGRAFLALIMSCWRRIVAGHRLLMYDITATISSSVRILYYEILPERIKMTLS